MARIGLITGGNVFAREVFLNEGRALWSQALPLALEKHGVLGVETAGTELLSRPDELDRFDAVLVARLPEGSWSENLALEVMDGPVPTLVEGPLPAACSGALGVEAVGAISERGWLTPHTEQLVELTSAYGANIYGEVRPAIGRPLPRPPDLEWSALDVPITKEQAEAWQAPGWDFDRWSSAGDAAVLAEWISAADRADRFPAIVRRGSLTGCSLSLFSYLGRAHTSEPFAPGENRTSPRVTGLEAILLGLVDEMHVRRSATRARIMPWPHGRKWVRHVRHDFDRALSAEATGRVLDGHARAGSAATWYWRARHAETEALTLVSAAGRHEVALHTERPWAGADAEREAIERATGVKVLGTSAHGAADCFRFQGAPNVIWAEQWGCLYTELIQHPHLHPHRFAALGPDGTVAPLGVICLPHHESFDLSTKSKETFAEAIDRALPLWIGAGGMCQIMNHPDINERELFEYLESMPDEGRLDWTAAEAASWWSRTHVREEMTLRAVGDGRFLARSRADVEGVVVEFLAPDGSRTERVLDLDAGNATVVSSAA